MEVGDVMRFPDFCESVGSGRVGEEGRRWWAMGDEWMMSDGDG